MSADEPFRPLAEKVENEKDDTALGKSNENVLENLF